MPEQTAQTTPRVDRPTEQQEKQQVARATKLTLEEILRQTRLDKPKVLPPDRIAIALRAINW